MKMALWQCVVYSWILLLVCDSVVPLNTTGILRQKVIDHILGPPYDFRIPPNYEEDFPVLVSVQVYVLSLDSVSETAMEYSMVLFLRQTWKDDRLVYDPIPNLKSLELDVKVMEKVWVPDLYILNEKKASFHTVTVPNKLMHIYPEGRTQYSIRISETLKCNMDLSKYPLDSQKCSMIMESYGYSIDNLKFVWHQDPVKFAPSLKIPQFEIVGHKTSNCDAAYFGVNYSCICLDIDLERNFGYYITQIYIPSILIIILSWVSFWIDVDAVPARISLGLLTVLTMTTNSVGVRSNLPHVSYIKAIDVWMAMCLFFVFAALIEFSFVNVLSRVQKRRMNETIKDASKPMQLKSTLDDEDTHISEIDGNSQGRQMMRFFLPDKEKARIVDRLSRVIFPTFFIIFNIIYWCVYVFWKPVMEK